MNKYELCEKIILEIAQECMEKEGYGLSGMSVIELIGWLNINKTKIKSNVQNVHLLVDMGHE